MSFIFYQTLKSNVWCNNIKSCNKNKINNDIEEKEKINDIKINMLYQWFKTSSVKDACVHKKLYEFCLQFSQVMIKPKVGGIIDY